MEIGNLLFGISRGEFPIEDRKGFEKEIFRLFNTYSKAKDNLALERVYGEKFENDTFRVFPYYWGECTCGSTSCEDTESRDHTKECLLIKPNFLYKPIDFEIKWYKYPLRDSYMNQKITLEDFTIIIDECIESLK